MITRQCFLTPFTFLSGHFFRAFCAFQLLMASYTMDLQKIIAAAGDAMVVCDLAGLITLWNPAAERMFGHTAAQALGQSLDLIIPERQRARHWEGYHKTAASGVTKYGNALLKVPALHGDGRTLSIAFSISLLMGEGAESGKVVGMLSIIRDETARFAEERSLKKRLAELESQVRGNAPQS
jgi:PAS domain S-box-containing protein